MKPRFSCGELVLLAVLCGAMLIVATGVQMVSVLLPATSRWMNVPLSTAAFLISVYAFTGILSPLFGLPSDRYGHGTFLLIGLSLFVLGNLLCAIAPNFPTLLVLQALAGLGYAIFGFSLSAVVGDVFAYEMRARAMGTVRLAWSAATLIGLPTVAAIADRWTVRGSFGAVGVLGLVALAVALVLLPRLLRKLARSHPVQAEADPRQPTESAQRRSVLASLVAVLAWSAIPTGMFTYLTAWLEQSFQLSATQVGLAFSVGGVGAIVGNALTATWADRLGKKRSAVLGLLVLVVMATILPRSTTVAGVLVCLVVFLAALEFGFASFNTLLTELDPAHRGTLMSLAGLVNGVGTGMVPLVMGPLWESGGYTVVTLVVSMLSLGAVAVMGLFVTERRSRLPEAQSDGLVDEARGP